MTPAQIQGTILPSQTPTNARWQGPILPPWTPNNARWQAVLPTVRAEAGAEDTTQHQQEQPTTPPETPPAQQARTFTQEDVDRLIAARLEREKKTREAEAAKAAEEAENKRLAEQKEFAKLAAQHEKRVREIEPQLTEATAERDALRAYVSEQIAAAVKDWPASLKKLIPEEGSALERLNAFTTAKAVYDELRGSAQQPATPARTPGNSRAPRPQTQEGTPADAERTNKRTSGRYAL